MALTLLLFRGGGGNPSPPPRQQFVQQDQTPLANAQAGGITFKCAGILLAAAAAVAGADARFGTHDANVRQASQGASWTAPNYAAQVTTPAFVPRAYVAQAPPDPTQPPARIQAPTYAPQATVPLFAPQATFGAHQDAVYNSQARGSTFRVVPVPLVVAPAVSSVVAALQDVSQPQPQIWAPNFSEGIATPLTPSFAPEQDNPSLVATVWVAPSYGSPAAIPIPVPVADVRFGSHDAWVRQSSQGASWTSPNHAAPIVSGPSRAYVAQAPVDATQVSAQIIDGLGPLLPAPVVRPFVALAQADATQVPASWRAPNYAAQINTVPPASIQYVSRPQDDTTAPQPITRQALGFTLAGPPIRPWVSVPQSDPTQPPAVVLAPNYAPQAASPPLFAPDVKFGAHQEAIYNAQAGGLVFRAAPAPAIAQSIPILPYSVRPQDDPTQIQPQVSDGLGYTLRAPLVVPYQARPQDDPTQIAALINAGLGSSVAVPPIRPFVSIPQADVSQIPAIVSPGLGSTLARPPIVPYVAVPQADPTQPPAVVSVPNYGPQAQIVTTPQPGMVFAYQVDPTQIPASWTSPNYAAQVVPTTGLDPRSVGRKHRNVSVQWGSPSEPKPEKKKASKQAPKPAAPSKLLLSLFAKGGIGPLPFPDPVKHIPLEPARTEKVRIPDAPWPEPAKAEPPAPEPDPEKLALEARAGEAVAEAARLAAEIARVQERMVAIEQAMEAQLDEARRDAAAHARRARAAEDETTREIARRVEEQRLAEDELRRAKNNLIAIQAAIQVFFSDDPDSL